ncbi:MAG: lytic transglycosylase domain-containing protein [Mycobacteriales bacterium]
MRLLRPGVVGVALASTLLSGVAVATLDRAGRTAAAPVAQTAADAAAAPEPLDLPGAVPAAPLGQAADRSRPAAPAPAPKAEPAVSPLAVLHVPDLLVRVSRPLTPAHLTALQAVRKVEAVALIDAGTVRVGGKAARVVGVDPSTFRALTPQETASSDELWKAVARGELAPSYGLARARDLPLGGTVTVQGHRDLELRVGALAAYGLSGIDLVTDRAVARSLGVVPSSAVVVSAPGRDIGALRKAVHAVLGPDAVVEVLRPEVVAPRGGKPRTYRELYIDSARYCRGLSWTVLAAIGQVESAHGRHLGPSSAGALGPMQFLPSTWAAYGIDGDGDGKADIMSPYDAVPSAARYLCRFGANRGPDGLYDAIFAYNHADWYVQQVLGLAAQYK